MSLRGSNELRAKLEEILCSEGALIACTGSPLRSDDRLGLLLCEELSESGLRVVKCEYGLENCLDEIVSANPSKLLVVDAVYSDKLNPGDVVLISHESIKKSELVLTSHSIPMEVVLEIVKSETEVREIYLLGVMVRSLDVGLELSSEVRAATKALAELIVNVVSECQSKRLA